MHARRLVREFAAIMRKVWALMKAQTKSEHLALRIAVYVWRMTYPVSPEGDKSYCYTTGENPVF